MISLFFISTNKIQTLEYAVEISTSVGKKSTFSVRKVIGTVFFDYEEVLFLDFKELCFNIKAERCVIFMHDIAHPHVAHIVQYHS